MSDAIHEAVCIAAGWEAYCKTCGSIMRRQVGLGCSYSSCTNEKCESKNPPPSHESIYLSEDEKP